MEEDIMLVDYLTLAVADAFQHGADRSTINNTRLNFYVSRQLIPFLPFDFL
jgi:hypothetical protein